jgi:kinesin family protein 3/17
LKFATRAKKIKNEARINEDVDQKTLLRKYQIELKKLKSELEAKTKSIGGMNAKDVSKLEAEKQKAEADKNAAINALEIRSHEFLQAQEEKRMLEDKIKAMNSQILPGGKKIEDTPQFRTALEEQ